MADSLVESGHLEQLAPVVRANRTLTISYRILSTDPLGSDRPKLSLVPPMAAENDEGQGSAPHPSEYLDEVDL